MPRLEIHNGPRRKVFEILDTRFVAGADPDCGLRLAGRGVAGRHVEFRWDGAQLEVLAGEPGVVAVNGRPVDGAGLDHGDVVDVGAIRLVVWLDGRPRPALDDLPPPPPADDDGLDLRIDAAAVATARRRPGSPPPQRQGVPRGPGRGPRRAAGGSGARAAGRRRGGRSGALLFLNLAVVTAAVGWLAYRFVAGVEVVREPQDSIALAEAQVEAGRLEQALATLGDARARASEPAVRAQIDAMRQRIEALAQQRRDLGRITAGRDDWVRIERVATSWLERRDGGRPAARWVVGEIDRWLETHGAVFAAYESTAPQLAAIRELRERHRAAAALDQPPTAADVLFAADRPLDYAVRRYAESIAILERWLAARGDDPEADRVRERLDGLRRDGPRWLAGQLEAVAGMYARGEDDRAALTLDRLEAGLPAEWLDPVRAARR